jgi:NAD(P)-dependent dehydrogenase (short-subunit alcohol dehydrogenase family)
MVKLAGKVALVVANAGIWSAAPFTETSDEMYLDMIDVRRRGLPNQVPR